MAGPQRAGGIRGCRDGPYTGADVVAVAIVHAATCKRRKASTPRCVRGPAAIVGPHDAPRRLAEIADVRSAAFMEIDVKAELAAIGVRDTFDGELPTIGFGLDEQDRLVAMKEHVLVICGDQHLGGAAAAHLYYQRALSMLI